MDNHLLLFLRSRPGNRTAIEEKMTLPVVFSWLPSLDKASCSTAVAGRTSVSMTTGETLGSETRISGRLAAFFRMPVFSELITSVVAQAWRVRRRTAASASLIVCSVVGI